MFNYLDRIFSHEVLYKLFCKINDKVRQWEHRALP